MTMTDVCQCEKSCISHSPEPCLNDTVRCPGHDLSLQHHSGGLLWPRDSERLMGCSTTYDEIQTILASPRVPRRGPQDVSYLLGTLAKSMPERQADPQYPMVLYEPWVEQEKTGYNV